MSKYIFTEDFLLQSETARVLYHQYVKDLPIIDYHCHLPPAEIASNKKFESLTEIWLKGDHYKWRALRAMGIEEERITGNASDWEKFEAWASIVPYTLRNPLFHWTHLELKNPFGYVGYLNKETAKDVYEHCNSLLPTDAFSTRGLLKHFKVEYVGTTDDPIDNLEHHKLLAEDGLECKVRPSFRPDKVLYLKKGPKAEFLGYLDKLSQCSGVFITDIATLLEALQKRVDYFHEHGCRIADHGLGQMPVVESFGTKEEQYFKKYLSEPKVDELEGLPSFTGFVLKELCKMYHAKGWVQQFHLGAIRNNNSRKMATIGADCGVDSIGDLEQATTLSRFLDSLDVEDKLAKTILYNLNPADNELFASMAGNFNDGGIKGKIQYGSAWWFLDQKDGMEKQLNALSNLGLISNFVGMLTDSRSFLSFPRHEYFRRIVCNLFGTEIDNGLITNDLEFIGSVLKGICYGNAKEYFGLG